MCYVIIPTVVNGVKFKGCGDLDLDLQVPNTELLSCTTTRLEIPVWLSKGLFALSHGFLGVPSKFSGHPLCLSHNF